MARKKTTWLLLLLLIMLLVLPVILIIGPNFLPFGPLSYDPFNPPDTTPPAVPSDWLSMDVDLHPATIEPINLAQIPARQIALPSVQSAALLLPAPDGGCLSLSQASADNDKTIFYLRAIRYRPDGSKQWDRRYDSYPVNGYPVSLCVFPDNSCAISLRLMDDSDPNGSFTDQLWRISPEGEILCQINDESVPAGSLDYLFARSDGAVVAAGTGIRNQTEGQAVSVIRVLCFDKNGRQSKSVTAAAETMENQMLVHASYAPEYGLALLWSHDDPAKTSYLPVYQVTFFNNLLDITWSVGMDAGKSLSEGRILPANGNVLITGYITVPASDTAAATAHAALICIGSQGTAAWTYTEQETTPAWLSKAAALTDGRIIAGLYKSGSTGTETTDLLLLSEKGQYLQTVAVCPGQIQQIIPTQDGGFTGVLRQSIRTLPQPPFISSIWVDSEAVIVHYDAGLRLVWQRAVDQYKHDIRSDMVIATTDDRLLIG